MRRIVQLLLATACAVVPLGAQRGARFDHPTHAKVFPTCTGCHAGVLTGDAAQVLPEAASCARCHDGTIEKRVTWTRPVRGPGLVQFSHPAHAQKAGREAAACQGCHQGDGAGGWMAVSGPRPAQCLTCHAHKATAHLADDNRCSACHRPLTAASGLSVERIGRLPKPPSHDAPAFLSAHAPSGAAGVAQCAVCHARESCARCHVDAGRNAAIGALGADGRVAQLVAGKPPAYPVPADHRRGGFTQEHGPAATAGAQRCAACHAQPSCRTCHAGDGAYQVIRQLPTAEEAGRRGVHLRRLPEYEAPFSSVIPASWRRGAGGAPSTAAPPRVIFASWPVGFGRHAARDSVPPARRVRVHPTGFATTHGGEAAAATATCEGCHSRRFCSDCHVGGERIGGKRFHAPNFVQRHGPEAYGRETDCQACHQTETYCRSCHIKLGSANIGAGSSARPGSFHNAQPLWFQEHGRAARQGLASCTSCHTQRDCMQCHSSAFRGVMPHGPDFDAAAMQKRNPLLCLRCHLTNPLAKRS